MGTIDRAHDIAVVGSRDSGESIGGSLGFHTDVVSRAYAWDAAEKSYCVIWHDAIFRWAVRQLGDECLPLPASML
jgi:hypothetical protein